MVDHNKTHTHTINKFKSYLSHQLQIHVHLPLHLSLHLSLHLALHLVLHLALHLLISVVQLLPGCTTGTKSMPTPGSQ